MSFDDDLLSETKLRKAREQYGGAKPRPRRGKPKREQDWELFREYAKLADRKSKRGLEIRTELVSQFENLYRGVVDKFAHKHDIPRNKDELEDYNQVAIEGMLYALERFQPERGLQFATPARHWIWFYLDKHHDKVPAVNQRRMSAIPQHLLQKQDKIRARLGRDATAAELGTTEAQLEKWRYPPTVQSVDVVEGSWSNIDGAEHFLTRLARTESSHQDLPDAETRMIEIEEADAHEDNLATLAAVMKTLTRTERALVKGCIAKGVQGYAESKEIDVEWTQQVFDDLIAKLRSLMLP